MTSDLKEKEVKKNRWGSFLLIFLVIIVIVVLFLIGLFYRLEERQELERNVSGQELPVVQVMTAYPDNREVSLTLPSFLVGYNVTPLLARTNGYLKNFYVDIGDHVKKGQLLCEIDTPDTDAELATARGTLKSLQAKEAIAKVTAERWERLYQRDPDAIPKEEVDETAAAYQSAIADVEAAKATVALREVLVDFKYVYAPFDGIIVERNIDIGSLISAGNESLTQPYLTGFEVLTQPLFKIAVTEFLRAFVAVPQPYYPFIKDGVKAQVTVQEHPDEVFSGVIDRNANALDQVARTLLTQVNIENKRNLLRPGLFTEVNFFFKPYENSFNIPIGALIIRDGPPFVALLKDDDIAFLQKVKIGWDFGKSVQIIEGLEEGDKIILNPNYRIQNGVKVRVSHFVAPESVVDSGVHMSEGLKDGDKNDKIQNEVKAREPHSDATLPSSDKVVDSPACFRTLDSERTPDEFSCNNKETSINFAKASSITVKFCCTWSASF
jgi:RND family efflux transporter MFP subunit